MPWYQLQAKIAHWCAQIAGTKKNVHASFISSRVLKSCEAQSCVLCQSRIGHLSPTAACPSHAPFTRDTRLLVLDILSVNRSSSIDEKYTNLDMKDLTESKVVIAVIAPSSQLRPLSHHQYKTIGHLMIF